MRLRWPFAPRQHDHWAVRAWECGDCGHALVPMSGLNKRVSIQCHGLETQEWFGAGCDPGFDLINVTVDWRVELYENGKLVDASTPIPERLARRVTRLIEDEREIEQPRPSGGEER